MLDDNWKKKVCKYNGCSLIKDNKYIDKSFIIDKERERCQSLKQNCNYFFLRETGTNNEYTFNLGKHKKYISLRLQYVVPCSNISRRKLTTPLFETQ